MQDSISANSPDSSALVALKKTLEDLLPDMLKKPSDDGVLAFYNFESELLEEEARKLVDAIMERILFCQYLLSLTGK